MSSAKDTQLRSEPPDAPVNSHRERILDASARCFARWGVEKTTLENVAKEAKLSRPHIYNSFANKEDLIRQTVLREATAIVDHFIETLPLRGASADIVVKRLIQGVIWYRSSQTGRYLVAYYASNHLGSQYPSDPELLEVHKRFWKPLFDYARARGELQTRVDDDQVLRWLLLVQLVLLEHEELYPTEADMERLLRSFIIPALIKPSTRG